MALLLNSDTIAAIAAGARTRQVWKILVPSSSGSNSYDKNTVHDSDREYRRVTDAGQYTTQGYNISFNSPGALTSGYYAFTARNDDQLFYHETANNFWTNIYSSYQATPTECLVQHHVYVEVNGSWQSVYSYLGRVQDVTIDEDRETATVESVSMAAVALEMMWSAEDAIEQDTGLNVIL